MYTYVPTSPPCKVGQYCCSSRSDLLTSCCVSETTGICTATNESGGWEEEAEGRRKVLKNAAQLSVW